METQALKTILQFALASAGKKDVRYYLNSVLIDQTDTATEIIATDGHRLSHATLIERLGLPVGRYILPREDIEAMVKMLPKTGACTISLADGLVVCDFGQQYRITPMDATYPDCQRILPDYSTGEPIHNGYGVNPEYLAQAGKALSSMRASKLPSVRMRIATDINAMRLEVVSNLADDVFIIIMPCKL